MLFLNPVDYVFTDLYYTLTYSVAAEISGGKLTAVRYFFFIYTASFVIYTFLYTLSLLVSLLF